MSIIEQTSALNLVRKVATRLFDDSVAIVTHASTALGATVCRTFLKHNCFVLGIDESPIHPSLNSRVGTHMQFLQCGGWNGTSPDVPVDEVLSACKKKFDGREGVDYLVTLEGQEKGMDFVEGVVEEMKRTGKHGLALNVLADGVEDAQLQQATKDAAQKHGSDHIRFNLVSITGTKKADAARSQNIFEHEGYKAVQSLKSANDSTEELVRARGIANLLLFLASSDCKEINAMAIGVDGLCQPL